MTFNKRLSSLKKTREAGDDAPAPVKATKTRASKKNAATQYTALSPDSGTIVLTDDGLLMSQKDLASALIGYRASGESFTTVQHSPAMKFMLENNAIPQATLSQISRAADAKKAASAEASDDDLDDTAEPYNPVVMLEAFLPRVVKTKRVVVEVLREIHGNEDLLSEFNLPAEDDAPLSLADLHESAGDEGDGEALGLDALVLTLNGKEMSAPVALTNYLSRVLSIAGQITTANKIASIKASLGDDADTDVEYARLVAQLEKRPLDRLIDAQNSALEAFQDLLGQESEGLALFETLDDAKAFLPEDCDVADAFDPFLTFLRGEIDKLNDLRIAHGD